MKIEDIKQKIDDFYGFSDKKQEQILDEIRKIAHSDKQQFIADVRNHFPQFDMSGIEVIYEALSQEPENWGDFFTGEFKRAFTDAKNSFQSRQILLVLDDISMMEKVDYPFAQDVIKVLSENIHSDNETLQYFALYYLADWLDDGNGEEQFSLLMTLNNFVYTHTNWRVRYLSHYALSMSRNLPKGLRISWKDRIRARLNNPLSIVYA